MHYYHITSPEKWETIRSEGLKCGDDGYIYFLNTGFPAVTNYIAFNQIFLDYVDFVLIEIAREGIISPMEIDQVAEITSYLNHQFRVAQDLVNRNYLRFSHRVKLTEQSVRGATNFLEKEFERELTIEKHY